MNKIKSILLIIILTFIFFACNTNILDIKLTNSPVSIDFINVDEQLNTASAKEIKERLKVLEQTLGDLFIYELSENIRKNINVDDSSYILIHDFYQSEYVKDLESEKKKLYKNLPEHEKKTNQAFQYLSFHFGDSLLPKQIFYINKLFSQIRCSYDNISVGLENYISPESEVIEALPGDQFYSWQRKRMNIDYLERDILLIWIQVHLFDEIDGNLAEHIIQSGKILYILNAAFPKAKESYILRYSDENYRWAVENEQAVWNYLVKEQMLFKSDIGTRINFLNEGPSTITLSDDSPDRMGQFIGYQIVKGFMKKNKTLSLRDLLEIKYNNILQTYEIK